MEPSHPGNEMNLTGRADDIIDTALSLFPVLLRGYRSGNREEPDHSRGRSIVS